MGVYDANGNRITKATFPATAHGDPVMVVDENVYESAEYGRYDPQPEGSLRKLLYAAGTKLRQSQIDKNFPGATVASIDPNSGPAAGGTVVTITGTHLDGVTGVTFGGAAGTALTIVDNDELRVTTPAGVAGAVDVVVQDDAGNVTTAGGYTYV